MPRGKRYANRVKVIGRWSSNGFSYGRQGDETDAWRLAGIRDGYDDEYETPRRSVGRTIGRTDETAEAAGSVIVIGAPTLSVYGSATTTTTTWLSVATVVTSAGRQWEEVHTQGTSTIKYELNNCVTRRTMLPNAN